MDLITVDRIKNQITNSIRRYNYIKLKLYLTELVINDINKVPPSRDIQYDIKVGKSSVSRTLIELSSEGWVNKVNGDSPRQEYYTINIDREYANNFNRAWLDIYHLSKKSKRFSKLLSHANRVWGKEWTKCG